MVGATFHKKARTVVGCGAQRRIRLRVIQVAYGDAESVAARLERVAAVVRAQRGADLVVLPELWAHGGFAFNHWHRRAESMNGLFVQTMSSAARDTDVALHAGSFVERTGAAGPSRGLTNTSVLFGPDGNLIGVYRKIHRFGFGEGEPVLIDAGAELVTAPLQRGGRSIGTLGLATCYDLRFPEMFRELVDQRCEVFVIPAAWPQSRVEHWTLLGRARAIENQCFVIQCNTAGEHSGLRMGGRSQVVAPSGEVLAVAGTDGEEVLDVEINLDEVSRLRSEFPVLSDRRLVVNR
jgi:predicted amidohydrolase